MALQTRPGPPRVLRPPIRLPLQPPAAPRPFPSPSPALRVAAPVLPLLPRVLNLRSPYLIGGALVLLGLAFLWGWLNSRSKVQEVPSSGEDVNLPAPSTVAVQVRITGTGGTTYRCDNGAFHTTQAPFGGVVINRARPGVSRYRVTLGEGTYGAVCSPAEAGRDPAAMVEMWDAAGTLVDSQNYLSPSRDYSPPGFRETPAMRYQFTLDGLSINGEPQPVTTPEREPSGPAPVVPTVPVLPAAPTAPRPRTAPALPPAPAPEEVPGLVPEPQPTPAPAPAIPAPRPMAPPITRPWTRPGIAPAPGTTPAPGTAPAPGTTPAPGTAPAPGELPFPSQDPSRPTQPTTPDGALVPTPPAPTPTTKAGEIAVGSKDNPITIVPRQVPATLEGIALELGRIERKQEVMLGDDSGGQPDWMEKARAGGDAAMRLVELIFSLTGGTTYTLDSPCEKDANGNLLPPVEVEAAGALNGIGLILNRLDAMAELLQVHKNLKQPGCKNPRPQGDPVTVNFEEI